MAKVSEVITWLSQYSPDESIALTGWWLKSDVENNNDIQLTEEQWEEIVSMHEENTEIHIDQMVDRVMESEEL